MERRSGMSSGFILVSFEGPFSEARKTEPVPRTVSLRRVKKILDGESGYDWNERSGRYDDAEDKRGGLGDHEAEKEPTDANADAFGDFFGAMEDDADDDNSHEELLHRIGALSRGGKR